MAFYMYGVVGTGNNGEVAQMYGVCKANTESEATGTAYGSFKDIYPYLVVLNAGVKEFDIVDGNLVVIKKGE